MCLARLIKCPKKYIGRRVGWKIFYKDDKDNLIGEYQGLKKGREENKWLDECDYRNRENQKYVRTYWGKYPTGWHIYLKKEDAVKWSKQFGLQGIVKKVRFKNPLVYGVQGVCTIVVAKKIFIEKRRKK